MKQFSGIVLFLFGYLSVVAQPTLTENTFINLNMAETIGFFDFNASSIDPGPSGANQTWNFSNIPISGDTCFYEILDPDLSIFRDSFPQSNAYFICTSENEDGEKVENHTFYINSAQEVILEGNVSLSISDPDFDSTFIVYHDPQINFSFPYSFETEHEDDYSARVTSYIAGQPPIVAIQEGTITTKADAYGTLTTAAGTFENVMRVYRFENAENSIPGIPFSSPQESHRYTWMSDDESYLMLNLDQTIIRDFMGNIVSQSDAGFYRKRGPDNTVNLKHSLSGVDAVKLFPNPAQDYTNLWLHITEPLNLELLFLGIDGKKLRLPANWVGNQKLGKLAKGAHQFNLDLSQFAKGTYILQIRDLTRNQWQSLPLTILK